MVPGAAKPAKKKRKESSGWGRATLLDSRMYPNERVFFALPGGLEVGAPGKLPETIVCCIPPLSFWCWLWTEHYCEADGQFCAQALSAVSSGLEVALLGCSAHVPHLAGLLWLAEGQRVTYL